MKPEHDPLKHRKISRGYELRAAKSLMAREEELDTEDSFDPEDYDYYDYERKAINPNASPLCSALADFASAGDVAGIQAMILAHPHLDPNQGGRHFELPLIQSAIRGAPDCARLLLDLGADAKLRDRRGLDALMWAAVSRGQDSGALCFLLGEAGADIHARDAQGRTPFLAACRAGNLAAALALADMGADPMARDSARQTGIDLAFQAQDDYSWNSQRDDDAETLIQWLGALKERDSLTADPSIAASAQVRKSARSL